MTTHGHVTSVQAAGLGVVPPAGDVDIYLQVDAATGGDDAHGGTSWADAVLTWPRAEQLVEDTCKTNPDAANITVHVRNGVPGAPAVLGAGSFTFAPRLSGHTRCHVVYDLDDFTPLAAGTVGMNGIVAQAGSGLAVVTLVAPIVVAGTEQGKTLRLTRPAIDPLNFGEMLCATILAADTVANTVTISVLNAAVPAFWDADAITIAEIIEAPSVLNGVFTFAPQCGSYDDFLTANAISQPLNYLVGIRANRIVASGTGLIGMAACEARTAASATPDGEINIASEGGNVLEYLTTTGGGVRAYVSDARARSWGLFGTTAVLGYCLGNGAQDMNVGSGEVNVIAGYALGTIHCFNNPSVNCRRVRAEMFRATQGGHLQIAFFMAAGTAGNAAMRAEDNGSQIEYMDGAIEEVVNGQAYLALVEDGAEIIGNDDDLEMLAAAPANYPVIGWCNDGGRLSLKGGVSDSQAEKINGILIWTVNMGDTEVEGITMAKKRPGVAGATDIVVEKGSRMTVNGNITKTLPNTIPGCCLDVDDCSLFVQKTGDFTHGNAPADWTASYGALGLIHVGDGSKAVLGNINDGGVGAGAGEALVVKRGSQLWYGTNTALTGNNPIGPLTIGVIASALLPATVLNDLTPGAGGVTGNEEMCVVGKTASP